ncbi:sulfur carrier protein ThiS [Vibrio hannami]|uniref:sulfur carrier protein ThiS n=1 Tax=Vibrio hannami TaxID=2717094 RepID=UPI0024103074|nr:sulfur carrier protein ThiS [Vibrio hannami]MDG3086716.1 sulfur carrier protein ThiS [Vibrio hannami]
MIKITINDKQRSVEASTTLDTIIASVLEDTMGYAAAINQSIIPKQEWAATQLNDGDSITLFQAIAGG